MPVILVVVSAGKEALSVSDSSFAEMLAINEPIRKEIDIVT